MKVFNKISCFASFIVYLFVDQIVLAIVSKFRNDFQLKNAERK